MLMGVDPLVFAAISLVYLSYRVTELQCLENGRPAKVPTSRWKTVFPGG